MHNLLALILLLFSVLAAFVQVAGTTRTHESLSEQQTLYHEHLPAVEAGVSDPSSSRTVRVLEQYSGFSFLGRGKQDIFRAELPLCECDGPLSESVHDHLWQEITTTAEEVEVNILEEKHWGRHYFVWDSYYDIRFHLQVCTPRVVSLLEKREYMHDSAAHPGLSVIGRNFIWQDSIPLEIGLADLFKDSPANEWFQVLAKEVEADIRRQNAYWIDDHLPFEGFDQFDITEKGLKILFQPYEIDTGPYFNFIEVVVSWDLLGPYLKPGAATTIWYQQLQKR